LAAAVGAYEVPSAAAEMAWDVDDADSLLDLFPLVAAYTHAMRQA